MVEYYTGNLGRIHYRTPSGEVGSRAFWGESALRAERASLQSKGYVEIGVTYTSMSGRQVTPQPAQESSQQPQPVQKVEVKEPQPGGPGIKPIPEKQKPEPSIFDKLKSVVGIVSSPQHAGYSASVVFNPDVIDIYRYQATGPIKNTAEETMDDQLRYASQNAMRNYKAYKQQWDTKDILGIGGRVISSPVGSTVAFAGLGYASGAFSMTKIGQTEAFKLGKISITPSKAFNVAPGVVFGGQAVKGGYEAHKAGELPSFLGGTAVIAPFGYYGFKQGYTRGAGYVQRTGAMSTLTDPLKRTQQQAIYDMMKINERLSEPGFKPKTPYDIQRVQKMNPNLSMGISDELGSFRGKHIRKTAIGGSTAMDIQIGGFFRKGGYPKRLLKIASERQKVSGSSDKMLRTGGGPVDVDLLMRGFFATEKAAKQLETKLDTHVHVSKTSEYLWGGYKAKPSTKGYVAFQDVTVKSKLLSVREQFTRYSISSLPSEAKRTGYRSFKDIPGMYDVGDALSFQKGGSELRSAMDRYIYPERYQPPRVKLGEKIIKRVGGSYEPEYVEIMGGGYVEPVYPKSYAAGRYLGGYRIGRYAPNVSYGGRATKYKPGYTFDKNIYSTPPSYPSKPPYTPGTPYFNPPKIPTYPPKPPTVVYPPTVPSTPSVPPYKAPPKPRGVTTTPDIFKNPDLEIEWELKNKKLRIPLKYRFRKAKIGLPYDMLKKMDIKVKNL